MFIVRCNPASYFGFPSVSGLIEATGYGPVVHGVKTKAQNRNIGVLGLFLLTALLTSSMVGARASEPFDTGMEFYENGLFESAVEHLDLALEIDSEDASTYLFLGRSLYQLERRLRAISYLRAGYLRLSLDD